MTDRAPLPSHVIQWLNTLQQALRPLPQAERDDIIREARAHLEDRIAAGLSPENALHGFGDARAYARDLRYLGDSAAVAVADLEALLRSRPLPERRKAA